MIKKIIKGNIFDSNCLLLVNPVNIMGVMGAGLAKQFKDRFPDNFILYRNFCVQSPEKFKGGDVLFSNFLEKGKLIAHVATKENYMMKSKIEWVEKGISTLFKNIYENTNIITSVAIPKLGCGLGGLNFDTDVYPLILREYEKYPIFIYKKFEIYV